MPYDDAKLPHIAALNRTRIAHYFQQRTTKCFVRRYLVVQTSCKVSIMHFSQHRTDETFELHITKDSQIPISACTETQTYWTIQDNISVQTGENL